MQWWHQGGHEGAFVPPIGGSPLPSPNLPPPRKKMAISHFLQTFGSLPLRNTFCPLSAPPPKKKNSGAATGPVRIMQARVLISILYIQLVNNSHSKPTITFIPILLHSQSSCSKNDDNNCNNSHKSIFPTYAHNY